MGRHLNVGCYSNQASSPYRMYVDLGMERSKAGVLESLNVITPLTVRESTRGADFGGVPPPVLWRRSPTAEKKSPLPPNGIDAEDASCRETETGQWHFPFDTNRGRFSYELDD
jgi:hypothetical protein